MCVDDLKSSECISQNFGMVRELIYEFEIVQPCEIKKKVKKSIKRLLRDDSHLLISDANEDELLIKLLNIFNMNLKNGTLIVNIIVKDTVI